MGGGCCVDVIPASASIIPADAGIHGVGVIMAIFSHHGHHSSISCIPCVLRFACTRPLRGAKGREMACFAFLWIPACAGMAYGMRPYHPDHQPRYHRSIPIPRHRILPFLPPPSHPSSRFWRSKSAKRFIEGLRAHRSLGIIYFSWHAARVARWRACKYYANIAQIRTEGVSGLAWHKCRQGSFTIVPGK